MLELNYPRIGETVLQHTLPNGLRICIVPKPGYHTLRRHGHEVQLGRHVV